MLAVVGMTGGHIREARKGKKGEQGVDGLFLGTSARFVPSKLILEKPLKT